MFYNCSRYTRVDQGRGDHAKTGMWHASVGITLVPEGTFRYFSLEFFVTVDLWKVFSKIQL